MRPSSRSSREDDWVRADDPAPSRVERLRRGWSIFSSHVQHRSRFLLAPDEEVSPYEPVPDYSPREILAAIAEAIVDLELSVVLPAGTAVYRARTFDNDLPFSRPDQLVSPGPTIAAQGRMNGAGIAVLYGALDPDTAAAEVYDGKDHVAIAEIRNIRDLAVVDLTQIPALSPFDPEVGPFQFECSSFLRGFAREITRPIARDDRVHYEYTPTQLFTEYLRWRLAPGVELDGVLYPSARTSGHNIVVFVGPSGCLADAELIAAEGLVRDEPQVLAVDGM